VSVTTARPETAEETTTEPEAGLADPWVTIVWNDPVNLMTYVTYVFESYFGYQPAKARQLMLQVHREGRAVVSTGPRERMEVDVQAMHSYGLWATMQRSGDGGAGAPGGAAEGAGA
jgi:ATP-dependent Clp protease adaptor protein ClpS